MPTRVHPSRSALVLAIMLGFPLLIPTAALARRSRAPSVSTSAAASVTGSSAVLEGTVNPNGSAASYHFQYGASTSYGSNTPSVSLASGTSSVHVQAALGGLAAAKTYHFRLVASNSHRTSDGSDVSLTTTSSVPVVPAPVVSTSAAAGLTGSSATLPGAVNPEGSAGSYHFQYGTSSSYGSTSPSVSFAAGIASLSVSAALGSLTPGTTYHFRLVASNLGGTTDSPDATFTTTSSAPLGMAPIVSTSAATGVSGSSATLPGVVNPEGSAGDYDFQYGTSSTYGSTTSSVSFAATTSSLSVSAALGSLTPGTTYHFRLVASNLGGTTDSSDMSFTTAIAQTGGSPYDAAVLADDPVGFWDMNPGAIATDLTGNGHTGSYEGGTPTSASLPNGDTGADFNGSSEYVTIPSSSAFSIPTTRELTWEAWIRPDVLQFPDPANSDGYVDWMGKCQNYSPTCEWEARMYSTSTSESRPNRLSAYVFNSTAGLGSGADWQPNTGLIQAGHWLFVVGEYDTNAGATPAGCSADGSQPGSINIWVDGVGWNESDHFDTGCMSQYQVAPKASSSPVNIGTMAFDSWFPGAVGKVAIYDTLLSQAQINAQYAAMTGTQPSGSCGNTCTIPQP
jgi:uncharacterized protein YegP (UPF0339 family)